MLGIGHRFQRERRCRSPHRLRPSLSHRGDPRVSRVQIACPGGWRGTLDDLLQEPVQVDTAD